MGVFLYGGIFISRFFYMGVFFSYLLSLSLVVGQATFYTELDQHICSTF